jgi:hypothetical protein
MISNVSNIVPAQHMCRECRDRKVMARWKSYDIWRTMGDPLDGGLRGLTGAGPEAEMPDDFIHNHSPRYFGSCLLLLSLLS